MECQIFSSQRTEALAKNGACYSCNNILGKKFQKNWPKIKAILGFAMFYNGSENLTHRVVLNKTKIRLFETPLKNL